MKITILIAIGLLATFPVTGSAGQAPAKAPAAKAPATKAPAKAAALWRRMLQLVAQDLGVLPQPPHHLPAPFELKLGKQVMHMRFSRRQADVEAARDLLVAEAGAQQPHHLFLAGSQCWLVAA